MPDSPDWFVYMVRCRDGSLYTGISTNVERRIREHNFDDRKGSRYVRSKRPVTLVYQEGCADRSFASIREFQIRKMNKTAKEKLISGNR
ncbi:MAG: GIY-YIG nuclease family protein [Gammaproteobacteria bacterium]|nr:GIY-YIG nuclease family protein [Gammaproteobacteria bacterium]